MYRTFRSAAVVSLGLLATGCATPPSQLSATNNPSMYSVHQPVVQRTDFVFDLATRQGEVSREELGRLDAWLASIQLRYGDRLTLDWPTYEDPRVAQAIGDVVARYGLLLSPAASPVTAGSVPADHVRVVASRATASVPGCPTWNAEDLTPVNNTSSNYGCATNSNLAAMVADPNDLIVGRDGSTDGTGSTAARAIRVYRQAPPTGTQGLQQTSTTQGGGSN